MAHPTVTDLVASAVLVLVAAFLFVLARWAGKRRGGIPVAILLGAIAIVCIPIALAVVLLVVAFGRGPMVVLMAFTTVPLAGDVIRPVARGLQRWIGTGQPTRSREGSPYSAVDSSIPASYWVVEAVVMLTVVALVGLVAKRVVGPDGVLLGGIPVAVALPKLLRGTLAPRMSTGQLAETIARLSAHTLALAEGVNGGHESTLSRLAELRRWTAELAQAHGLNAPAIVLAPDKAVYIASSSRSSAVIVINEELFPAFQTSELYAVMAHEIAHLKRHERLRRALAESSVAAWYFGALLVLLRAHGPLSFAYWFAWILAYSVTQQAVERWSIRRGEFSADLAAAQWLGDTRPMISALRTMARVWGVPLTRRARNRPSLAERIAALDAFQGASN
ncbi:MAG: M48 family metalloprotease [bacterium]